MLVLEWHPWGQLKQTSVSTIQGGRVYSSGEGITITIISSNIIVISIITIIIISIIIIIIIMITIGGAG